jgi:hypothetical protein
MIDATALTIDLTAARSWWRSSSFAARWRGW